MNRITKLAALPVAALLAAGGALLASGPASAAPCSGASCQEGASVTVQASITETITTASFAFNGGSAVTAGNLVGPEEGNPSCTTPVWVLGPSGGSAPICAETALTVATGDQAGYTIASYGSDFSTGSRTIPVTNMKVLLAGGAQTAGDFLAGGKSETSDSAHPVTLATTSAASGGSGDSWSQYDQLMVPNSVGNGAYTSTINMLAVAQ
jgi:hypothetical protein